MGRGAKASAPSVAAAAQALKIEILSSDTPAEETGLLSRVLTTEIMYGSLLTHYPFVIQ